MSTITTSEVDRRRRLEKPLSRGQLLYLAVLRRGDPDACFYCHVELTDENRTLDHYVPLRRGGPDVVDNIKLACLRCNRNKGDQLPGDFMLARMKVVRLADWQQARRDYNRQKYRYRHARSG